MPVPSPCMAPDHISGSMGIWIEKCVIIQSEIAVSTKPPPMIRRTSTRPTSRPMNSIASSVPAPRGAVAMPACSTE